MCVFERPVRLQHGKVLCPAAALLLVKLEGRDNEAHGVGYHQCGESRQKEN